MFDEHLTKKEKLFLGVLGILAILIMVYMEIDYRNSVETCVAGGQNREVCEIGLR